MSCYLFFFFFVNASDFDDDSDVEVDRGMGERISEEGTVYIVPILLKMEIAPYTL